MLILKILIRSNLIIVAALFCAFALSIESLAAAQENTSEESTDNVEVLRAAVEAEPGDVEAHRAYLKTFATADEAKPLYERWMKIHPDVAAIPYALGNKYGHYSPEAHQYWLKAAKLEPGNPEIWKTLALDASIRGGGGKELEYAAKAAAADPNDLGLQYAHARALKKYGDEAKGKKATLDLAAKHPKAGETVTGLVGLAYDSSDILERIGYMERLRKTVSGSELTTSGMSLTIYHVAMTRLVDAYIQTGQYSKAIELSEAMISEQATARMNFEKKLPLARNLAHIEDLIRQGQQTEARQLLDSVQTSQVNLFKTGSHVELLKASVLDATGSTREAYDALLAFQARTPDPKVKTALEQYGRKLGKDMVQIQRELRTVIAANSRPAPEFALDTYTGEQVKLTDLRGKVVLMSFWYPGCGPCRGEMPHMEAGIKGIDKNKLVYLGVNGLREQDDFVRPFMQASGYSFTPLGGTDEMVKAYGVHAYPTNFIIDQDGKIAYEGFMIGGTNETMLELMIRSLID